MIQRRKFIKQAAIGAAAVTVAAAGLPHIIVNKKKRTVLLVIFLLSVSLLFGQTPAGSGGGAYTPEHSECLSEEQRAIIVAKLKANEQRLRKEGTIARVDDRSVASFGWPLKVSDSLGWNSCYMVNNFVDHQQGNGVLDYYCGNRTYNGHLGTDISLWPFPWYLKTNDLVQAVAAEDGVIIGKDDGNFDEYCIWGNNGDWNAVYVMHNDGSVTWYGHLKQFSLTPKPVGTIVSKGEPLGIVASSGFSTGVHLHFEVYRQLPYLNANLIDPYSGVCNSVNTETWWGSQQPYWKPTLNALLTHDTVPTHGCPSGEEKPRFSNYFPVGSRIYTVLYFRDEQQGQITTMRLRRPNSTISNTWTHTAPMTYSGSWWWWYWYLPVGAPFGTWKFEATFNGETFVHEFVYGNPASTGMAKEGADISIFPNPTAGDFMLRSEAGGEILLQIFDSVGRSRYSGQAQLNKDIHLAALFEPGVYFVRAHRDNRVHLFKIVKE